MKINLAAGTYQHPTVDINNQACINYFPYPSDYDGAGQIVADNGQVMAGRVLIPTPGKTGLAFINNGGPVKALMKFNETVYAIAYNAGVDSVYKLTIDINAMTAIGTLIGSLGASTVSHYRWATNPTQIFITAGNSTTAYILTASTDTLAAISDGDFTGASDVVFAGSYFIYSTPNASTLYATAANDGTNIDALDLTTAEQLPDLIVGLAVIRGEVWVFGKASIEMYYNAGNASGFPFSPRIGAGMTIGCSAKNSIAVIDTSAFWLDHRRQVCMSAGYDANVISTDCMNATFQTYVTVSDAYAFTHTYLGEEFYVITFPTANKTWSFGMKSKQWHERAHWDPANLQFEKDIGTCSAVYADSVILVGGVDGIVYYYNKDNLLDGEDQVHRIRRVAHQDSRRKYISIGQLIMMAETGAALDTGTGSDPYIMMRYSIDAGHNWSFEMPRSLGTKGQYGKEITWNRLGGARMWTFEFRVSDPCQHTLIDLEAEIEVGS